MKTIAYARVSTKEQEREGYSLEAQKYEFERYAASNGFEIDKFISESVSAKRSDGRPEFNQLLKDIRNSKKPMCLLVHKIDRLARNYSDYGAIEELICYNGLEIHLVHDRKVLNKNSPSSEFAACGFNMVMARNYVINLSTEVKKGMYEKARQGWMPGNVPYGYHNDRNTRTIELIEQEGRFVARAFELYARGNTSLKLVSEQLFNEGYIYKPGKPKIDRSSLDLILRNRFYTGQFKLNDEVYPGLHQPLISIEQYDQVQQAFKKANRPKDVQNHGFTFAGLMTCGRCGCAITGQIQKTKYIYYHCTNYHGTCKDQPYTREGDLSQQFAEAFKPLQVPEEYIHLIIDDLRKGHQKEIKHHEQHMVNMERQISQNKDRLNQLLTMRLDGEIDSDTFKARQNQIQDTILHLEASRNAHTLANLDYIDKAEKILELAKAAYSLYLTRNPQERRKLIDLVLYNCTLDAGKLHYEYHQPFDLFYKMATCTEWWAVLDSNQRPPQCQLKLLGSLYYSTKPCFQSQQMLYSSCIKYIALHFVY